MPSKVEQISPLLNSEQVHSIDSLLMTNCDCIVGCGGTINSFKRATKHSSRNRFSYAPS